MLIHGSLHPVALKGVVMNSRRSTSNFSRASTAEDSTAGDLLHCGISVPLMTALGHSRPVEGPPVAGACPLRSESGHALASLDMSAKCHEPNHARRSKRERE